MIAVQVGLGLYIFVTPLEAWWLAAYPDGCATN